METDSERDQIDKVLFNDTGNSNIMLEQYKAYIELADRVSERRQNANSFYLSINTAICALIGYILSEEHAISPVVLITGILVSYLWCRSLKSYQSLNSAKFKVIHSIEARLPLALFYAEWIALGEGKDKNKYTPLTKWERWIPICFIVMYFLLFFGD